MYTTPLLLLLHLFSPTVEATALAPCICTKMCMIAICILSVLLVSVAGQGMLFACSIEEIKVFLSVSPQCQCVGARLDYWYVDRVSVFSTTTLIFNFPGPDILL